LREKISITGSKDSGLDDSFSQGEIDKGRDHTSGLSLLCKEWILGPGYHDFPNWTHFNLLIALSKKPSIDFIQVNFGSGAVGKTSPLFQVAIIEFNDPALP
jgi:hypothetical protein